jgi:hypothetical protein
MKVKKAESELNPILIQNFVKESEKETSYGKNMFYLKWLDVVLSCLVISNIVISLIDNEIYLSETNNYVDDYLKINNVEFDIKVFDYMSSRDISTRENILRFINCKIVICIMISIYFHYFLKVRILKATQKLSDHEGILNSGFIKSLIIELIMGSFVYPPYINHIIYGQSLGNYYAYSVNSLICILVTLKSYIILRVYTYFSRWTSDTAKSLCLKHHVVPGVHFAMKAELKKRPYTILALFSLWLVIIFSFAVRTFEYYVVKQNIGFKDNKLRLLTNSIWIIIITMTTVGYGDIYLYTHTGRFIGVISCVIGLLLVSLMVVSLAIISEFTDEEKKAYSILIKINADTNAINKAHNVIKTFLNLRRVLIEKKKFKLSERFLAITQLKKDISTFKNDYKIANSYSLPIDEMLKVLQMKLKDDINCISNNIKKISNFEINFKSISDAQKKCVEKMQIISKRQEKIGRYMVELNNNNFLANSIIYNNSREKSTKENREFYKVESKENILIKANLLNSPIN